MKKARVRVSSTLDRFKKDPNCLQEARERRKVEGSQPEKESSFDTLPLETRIIANECTLWDVRVTKTVGSRGSSDVGRYSE